MAELDRRGLAETMRAISEAIDGMAMRASQLGEVVVSGRSDDQRVLVEVTQAGRVQRLRLREDVVRRYDVDALGELVTRTIRDTQLRARAAYSRAVADIEPPEFVADETGIRPV